MASESVKTPPTVSKKLKAQFSEVHYPFSFDCASVGQNLHSLLWALKKQWEGGRVIHLKHPELVIGAHYQYYISECDVALLRAFGLRYHVYDLAYVGQFYRKLPTEILLSEKRLYLGQDFYSNLTELARKIDNPHWTSLLSWAIKRGKRDFNQMMIQMIANLAQQSINLKIYDGTFLTVSMIEQYMPREMTFAINALFKDFEQGHDNDSTIQIDDHLELMIFSKMVFQKSSQLRFDLRDFYHCILELLSPQYFLDVQLLEKGLEEIFSRKGGVNIEGKVVSWDFFSGKNIQMELDHSFGLIEVDHLSLFGGEHSLLANCQIEGPSSSTALLAQISRKEKTPPFFNHYIGSRIIQGSKLFLNTAYSSMTLYFQNDQHVLVVMHLFSEQYAGKKHFHGVLFERMAQIFLRLFNIKQEEFLELFDVTFFDHEEELKHVAGANKEDELLLRSHFYEYINDQRGPSFKAMMQGFKTQKGRGSANSSSANRSDANRSDDNSVNTKENKKGMFSTSNDTNPVRVKFSPQPFKSELDVPESKLSYKGPLGQRGWGNFDYFLSLF